MSRNDYGSTTTTNIITQNGSDQTIGMPLTSSSTTMLQPLAMHTPKDAIQSTVKDDDKQSPVDMMTKELGLLFRIAFPTVATHVCMFLMFPMAASSVGRLLGTQALAGYSLGSLVGNLTCLSVMMGTLTAAETLFPRAYGSAAYPELGRLVLRCVVVCMGFILPAVTGLMVPARTERLLVQVLGQDPVAASSASRWIPIYFLGTPAMVVFRVLQRFLVAQHVPWHPVFAGLIPTFVILPYLLQHWIPLYGVNGSAYAIVCTQWLSMLLLCLACVCCPVHHPQSWPRFSREELKQTFQWKPMMEFVGLGLGGVLSLSDWWFWEAMCFVAGRFGVVELCAHSIAYNFVPLINLIPLGTSIGLSVRVGTILASAHHGSSSSNNNNNNKNSHYKTHGSSHGDNEHHRDNDDSADDDPVRRAKLLAAMTMALIAVQGTVVSFTMYAFRETLIRLFTQDPKVIQVANEIWPRVCYFILILHIFAIQGGILRALAMQWKIAQIMVLVLWCGTFTSVIWFALIQGGGLGMEWILITVAYTVMQIFMCLSYTTADWKQIRLHAVVATADPKKRATTMTVGATTATLSEYMPLVLSEPPA